MFDDERTALAFSASWPEQRVHDTALQAAPTPMLTLDEVARLRRLDLASAVRRAGVMALMQGVSTVDRIA